MNIKRALDFAASLVGLALLWPVIAALLLAIRLSTGESPLLVQTRVGRFQQPFQLLKLRTMLQRTAHVPSHHVEAAATTPIGRHLRRWKLDELPQLVNVLRGEMSLVGPRPCLPTQRQLIDARIRSGALDVLPGITGLAQINGIDMSDPERLAEVDGEYARTRTLKGDLKLILATLTGGGLGSDAAARHGSTLGT